MEVTPRIFTEKAAAGRPGVGGDERAGYLTAQRGVEGLCRRYAVKLFG